MAASTAKTGKKPRGRGKPFVKGQSGNPAGRPIGSRQRLSEGFIDALSEDFDRHGKDTIRKMRTQNPAAYVRVVAELVPKDVNLKHTASDAFVALWQSMGGAEK